MSWLASLAAIPGSGHPSPSLLQESSDPASKPSPRTCSWLSRAEPWAGTGTLCSADGWQGAKEQTWSQWHPGRSWEGLQLLSAGLVLEGWFRSSAEPSWLGVASCRGFFGLKSVFCTRQPHLHRLTRGPAAFHTAPFTCPSIPSRSWRAQQCPTPKSSTPEDEEKTPSPLSPAQTRVLLLCPHWEGAATKAHGAAGLITATHRRGSHTHQPSRSSAELCHCRSTFQIYI